MTQFVAGSGKGIQFLRDHMADEDGPCLIWPMARDPLNGYGLVGYNAVHYKAHRLMCILVHGGPPTPKHRAAHSCGKGKEGCVHPKHVSWKTDRENAADRHAHGTLAKPGRPRRKITPEQAAWVRSQKGKMTQAALAEALGVHHTAIGQIQRGEMHQDRPARYRGGAVIPDRDAKIERARQLYAEGRPLEQIAKEIDVTRVTVTRWVDA